MAEAMTGPGYFYAAINESQLLRAFGTFTIAAHIRNPGYRPAYSLSLIHICVIPSSFNISSSL